jgi:hypothetical protein
VDELKGVEMNLSEAKVGDKIVMEFTVNHVSEGMVEAYQPGYDRWKQLFNKERPVISITSPSKKIEVGLKFKFEKLSSEWEIIAIHKEYIWCRNTDTNEHLTYTQGNIERTLEKDFNK